MKDNFVSYCSIAIAIVGCAFSVYNFGESQSRRNYESKCLVESRFLTIRTRNGEIQTITFRFCLTNISMRAVALRKIYFIHPALNNGKRIPIDQIGETHFDFAKENEFKLQYKERKSSGVKGSQEVLPYILRPNTKYEGHAVVGINDKVIARSRPVGDNPAKNMIVILEFNRPQRHVIPITYKEIYSSSKESIHTDLL